jgi:hypothetical protein
VLIMLFAVTHRVHFEYVIHYIASSGSRCTSLLGAADDATPHAEAIVAIA